jgi:hypothetical protein
MRLFDESATTISPLEETAATALGPLKLAAVPVPSANAALPLPASVVTTPRGVTRRMRLLFGSATTITPLEGITSSPKGKWKLAAARVPSANAAVPLPARVVTTPRGDTSRMRWPYVSHTTMTPLEGITASPRG